MILMRKRPSSIKMGTRFEHVHYKESDPNS